MTADRAGLTLTAADVAATLGMARTTFHRRRPELERLGFPPRLPGTAVWSAWQVRQWIRANGAAPPPANTLAEVTQQLEARITAPRLTVVTGGRP